MANEERQNNGIGADCSGGLLGNGFAIEIQNGVAGDGSSAGSSCESFRTYKRRRHSKLSNSETKLLEDKTVAAYSVNQLPEKAVEEAMDKVLHSSSFERVSHTGVGSHAATSGLGDCPLNRWRNIVLEQFQQSLGKSEGGLQGCIRDTLLFYPDSSCRTATKGEEKEKCSLQRRGMFNGTQNDAKGHVGAMSDGLLSESKLTNTELCRRAFFDIVMSEKFAQLCCLLLENFQGIKVDNILDISLISSRMKDGAYERSPTLFLSDMQQLWSKLQKIGAEMLALSKSLLALSKSLLDKSKTSYCEQFLTRESVLHTKMEQTEARGVSKVCACRRCGDKANGKDCLVCDSCEEIYHVSCIEPAVEEIPSKSWYCAECSANGSESPHDNCALCDKLNSTSPPNNGVENDALENEETSAEDEDNSNGLEHGLHMFKGGENVHHCNVCGNNTEDGEAFKVCGHRFCPHKFYHVGCLTSKESSRYGPLWYCPSCLCRSCLTDQDDEKIVLCDGCDHAYHIYCMQPPRTSIPRGKWFCRNCDAGIQQIHEAKRSYQNVENKPNKRVANGKEACGNLQKAQKEKDEELVVKSGGVDMLLTAARTLNYEEKLAAIEMKISREKEVLGQKMTLKS